MRSNSDSRAWRNDFIRTFLERDVPQLGVAAEQCYFWATHTGAELDFIVVQRGRRYGFEIKRTTAPQVTPSMRAALEDIGLARLDVIHAGTESFPLAPRVRALAAERLLDDLKPTRP